MRIAYGWKPDSDWGTNPLWQANLSEGQNLKNASYHYLISDHLGTPQLAINSTGEQSWKINSDAFGNSELDANNQITMNLRFPGQYYDAETGLSYNYFRDYDAKTGRYIQSDPIGLEGGINTYGYVGGNPMVYSDPTGEADVFPIGVVGAIGETRKEAGNVGLVGAGLGLCFLVPECRKNLQDIGSNGAVDELPYISSEKHPKEAGLIKQCSGKKGYRHDPNGRETRCKQLEHDIHYLVMRIRIRAGERLQYNGGDWGHQKRYNATLNALKTLVKAAQDNKCDYDSEADEILEMSWRDIGGEKPVPNHLKRKYN
jgi:RHS repeat-associated protein